MNFLLHRQRSGGHVLPIPEGLQELMADISREVLRCQPSADCTYKLIADYLEAMVKTRDKCKIAMEIVEDAILKTDEVYSEFAKCNFPKDKTDSFLNVMEIAFRRFVDQKRKRNEDPRFIKFHADDMLVELVRKCDLTKVEVLRSRPAIQWAYTKFVKTYLAAIEGTLDTEDLYLNTEKVIASSKELNQMHQSAIQIQKVFRGYQTRKSLQRNQQLKFTMNQISSEDSSSTSSFRNFILGRQDEMTKAAIKIQASFKGFYVRKKNVLEKKRVSLRPYNQISEEGRKLSDATKESPLLIDNSESFKDFSKEEGLITTYTEKIEVSPLEDINEIILEAEPLEIACQEDSKNDFRDTQEDVLVFSNTNTDLQDLNEAAVKIQATFKGYLVRKEMSEENKQTRKSKTFEEQNSNVHSEASKHSVEDLERRTSLE